MTNVQIKTLKSAPEICVALSEILIETVANGGSVSFMHPLSLEAANEFWRTSLASADRGERVILGAFDGDRLIGTVTLLPDLPPNQPHRAEIAKVLVHSRARRRGIGEALMRAAEGAALALGRDLLVLDTDEAGAARRLYNRLGWTEVGTIPRYALMPDGRDCGSTFFYKQLG